MQKGVNRVIIVGNLGQDPEVKYLPNGGAVTNITLATSESWKDKQTGESKESVEWHRAVLFGKVAEVAGEYLRKGSQVYIEGKLQTRKWQDQSGNDRYTTEIVVPQIGGVMQMLGGKGGDGGNRQSGNQRPQSQTQQTQQPQGQQYQQGNEPPMDWDDSIPF